MPVYSPCALHGSPLACRPAPLPRARPRACLVHHQHHGQQRHVQQRQQHFVAAAAAAAAGGGSGGSGSGSGSGSGNSSPSGKPGAGGDSSRPHAGSWLRRLALGVGGFVLLGLAQPWTLLPPSRLGGPIDTRSQRVAVIVPVLNEAACIAATLQQLAALQPPAAEVIVVDGGSQDSTVKLAKASGLATRVVSSAKGRAVQQNAGAQAASSELLCFLHADTQPPRDLVAVMRRELRDPRVVLAGFVPSIEVPGRRLWLLSLHNAISSYYAPLLFRPLSYLRGLRGLFGDQTLFCRACDFRAVGGFDPKLRIMEDIDLCVRLHTAGPCRHQPGCRAAAACGGGRPRGWCHAWLAPRGRIKQVCDRVSVTSGRRLDAWGAWRATCIHLRIGLAWYLGRDAAKLEELYERLYTDAFR